jgi:hypothetical protein
MKHISAIWLFTATFTLFGCGHYSPSHGWITLFDGFRKVMIKLL